jgi:hypothetical protein
MQFEENLADSALKIFLDNQTQNEKIKSQNALSIIRLMSVSKYLHDETRSVVVESTEKIYLNAAIQALVEKFYKNKSSYGCSIYIRKNNKSDHIEISSPPNSYYNFKDIKVKYEDMIKYASELLPQLPLQLNTPAELQEELDAFIAEILNEIEIEGKNPDELMEEEMERDALPTSLQLNENSIYITITDNNGFKDYNLDKVIYMYNTSCYMDDAEDVNLQGIKYENEKLYIVSKSYYVDEDSSGMNDYKEQLKNIKKSELKTKFHAVRPNKNKFAYRQLLNIIDHIQQIMKLS